MERKTEMERNTAMGRTTFTKRNTVMDENIETERNGIFRNETKHRTVIKFPHETKHRNGTKHLYTKRRVDRFDNKRKQIDSRLIISLQFEPKQQLCEWLRMKPEPVKSTIHYFSLYDSKL